MIIGKFAVLAYLWRNFVGAANILGLMGLASPSHHIWNSVLMHALAERGHNLTILSVDIPKPTDKIPPNVYYIHLEKTYETMYESGEADERLDLDDLIGMLGIKGILSFYNFASSNIKGLINSDGYKTLMNYPNKYKFDLVIYDHTFGPMLLAFYEKFNRPPLIGLTAFLNNPVTIDIIGHHYFPGYVPYWSTVYDVNMTFFERIENTVIYMFDFLYRHFVYIPRLDKMMRPLNPPNTPYLGDLQKKTVLALVNSHPAINYPESLPPNVIEVGGMQITEPKPLPAKMESFINSSKSGAILFSLGTNMRSENMGQHRIDTVLEVMRQLPQYNFLWKFDYVPEKSKLPKNVLIQTFFPQRDILAHPKLKVFVSHSGGLSTQEATWAGVPMIGMALFVDQFRNLKKTVLSGGAAEVDFLTLNVDSLKNIILEVAENPKYAENMKLRSKRFRDQPMKPLERAIWWVEYVLRNPSPDHLRSPALDMNFFSAHSLDVIGIFLVLIIALLSWPFISYRFLMYIYERFYVNKKLKRE